MRKALILTLCIHGLGATLWSQSGSETWQIEKIADGFVFTEGPVWRGEKLYFSDLGDSKIYTWSRESGLELFLDPSGKTNGLAIDKEGRLVMAQQEFRRMSRQETDATITPLATHFEGLRLNIPNDVAAKSDGSIFFTDPPIGISEGEQELDFSGIYRISLSGELYLLDKTVERPNGITFSRDESTLYVSDSRDKEVYAWDVEDTVITNKRLFTTIGGNGYIDGMTTDDQGRLYVASPFGVSVFEKDGSRSDTILIGKQCSNCSWGSAVGEDLFVTSGTELYLVNRQSPGVGFEEMESRVSSKTELFNPAPNPFHGTTRISFYNSRSTHARVKIFSSTGAYITTLLDRNVSPGLFHVDWHAKNLGPGVYYVQLETESGIQSIQIFLQ